MKVEIQLKGGLKNIHAKTNGRLKTDVPNGTKIADVIAQINIPEEYFAMIVIGNKVISIEYELQNNDIIEIYPVEFGG